jgi:zinc resistance-associated protein
MKRLTAVLGILVLVGALAVPVFAWGPGWGRGHHMMGFWGNGPGYGERYGDLTSEQKSKLDALDRKYYDQAAELRNQMGTRSTELDALLSGTNPDLEKAKAVQKEISELGAKLDESRLNYELEARKIVPDQRSGYAYGGGYGRHMGPYGYGMGYGPGTCWD